jgi:enoyl-CoA hydratase/carnithine racemase
MSDPTPRVLTERRDHVFLIGLDRAAKLNAFDRQMLRELAEAMTAYEDDPELRCAVLYATGENFTSGLDLADVGPAVAAGESLFPDGLVDPFGLTGRARTKPLVHAARGWCLTIGTELALAADVCVAAPDTRYGQIEVKRGIMPFGGATIRLPQVVGWHNAMRYLLTGDVFDAAEARRIGLVQEVSADADGVFDLALGLAERIAGQAPLAVQASLASARKAALEGTRAAADAMLDDARALMATEDAAEGMRSFVERRDADFKGR